MARSRLRAGPGDEAAPAVTAFPEALTGTLPEVVCPVLPAETAATPRPTGEAVRD